MAKFKPGSKQGKRLNEYTSAERKVMRAKATETNRKNKAERESIQETVNLMLKVKPNLTDEELKGFVKFVNKDMNNQQAIVAVQIAKAILSADTKAAEFVRDSSGQKPTNNINLSGQISYEQALKEVKGKKF